jgi:hypothetical protein
MSRPLAAGAECPLAERQSLHGPRRIENSNLQFAFPVLQFAIAIVVHCKLRIAKCRIEAGFGYAGLITLAATSIADLRCASGSVYLAKFVGPY